MEKQGEEREQSEASISKAARTIGQPNENEAKKGDLRKATKNRKQGGGQKRKQSVEQSSERELQSIKERSAGLGRVAKRQKRREEKRIRRRMKQSKRENEERKTESAERAWKARGG